MSFSRAASPPLLFNQGLTHHQAGRLAEAEAIYRRVLSLDASHADAWHLLGVIAFQSGQNETAVNHIGHAIRRDGSQASYYNNLGNALLALGHAEEAELSYNAALALNPRHVDARANLGNVLRALGRPKESEACCRMALRQQPKQPETHNNLGNTLQALGRLDEAEASYRKAIRLQPDYADAHSNLGHLLLLRGRFAEAWPEYEWRWRTRQMAFAVEFAAPRWTGAPLDGRTLLIHAEQGLGDTLQFCRYVAQVAATAGGPVVLEVQRPLARLMATLAGDARIVAKGDPLPAYDLHCPLLSLPGVLGLTVESIPPTRAGRLG
jgi:Flp pilus assembly protein TadD